MSTGGDPAEMAHHWPIGRVVRCTTLHQKGTVWLFTTAAGETFVLKKITFAGPGGTRAQRLTSEYHVLLHLESQGVPVAVPLLSVHGLPYVEHDGRLYTLSPSLVPPSAAPRQTQDAAERSGWDYAAIGASIGALHRALASYPHEIRSWRIRLPDRVLKQAVPVIAAYLGEERDRFIEQVAALTPGLERVFAGLPEQHIHGDCHMGNILLGDTGVVGFIDLDHLPVGPRVYDLGYVLADMVKWRIADAEEVERWLALAPHLIAGYEQGNSLSKREKESLWYVLLAVQLLFAEHFVTAQDAAGVRLNLGAFAWFAEHGPEIGSRLLGYEDHTRRAPWALCSTLRGPRSTGGGR